MGKYDLAEKDWFEILSGQNQVQQLMEMNQKTQHFGLVLTEEEAAAPDGWQLVCVDDYPLGWGKKNRGTLKNKYHSGWRLV